MLTAQQLKTAGFTLLRADSLGFYDLRIDETGDVISVWFADVKLGSHEFKRGTDVDYDKLGTAMKEMMATMPEEF